MNPRSGTLPPPERSGTGTPVSERPATGWRSPLTATVLGFFLFETLSGLVVWLAPFSLTVQLALLVHTAAGLPFIVLYAIYQTRHWLAVRDRPFTHHKLTGYTALALMIGCAGTGFWLTAEGLFGRRITPLADLLHIATGLAVLGVVVLHLAPILVREAKRRGPEAAAQARIRRRSLAHAGLVATLLAALVAGWRAVHRPPSLEWRLPEGYSFSYGEDRPFAPSLARTESGGALHPRSLSGSHGCGASGCHDEIYYEWQPSAHRYASSDVAFQAVQKVMAENEGPDSTRYCAGCHDPVALFSGSKNIYDDDLSSPGADEGVSCIACHRLVECDLKGNASYVIAPPEFYAYELEEGPVARVLANFLIRTYPKRHAEQYTPPLLRSPEYCGACHKQFIDEEINDFGWVQLQNQYDNWRKSHWNREGDPGRRKFCAECHERKGVEPPEDPEGRCRAITVECRECHMRLSPSRDPAAGDVHDLYRTAADGRHRNHRFIGANQFLPEVLGLPGHEEQVRLTEEWLGGRTVLPEIGFKWPVVSEEYARSADRRPRADGAASGPVLPIRVRLDQEVARAGEEVRFGVEILSRKVGHDFPTGPLDIIQSWVETVVRDAEGRELYRSGRLTGDGFIEEGAFIFKAEGVDARGNLIDRHNLWELVGARFKRALFPGFTDTAEYRFACPSQAAGEDRAPKDEQHAFVPSGPLAGPLRIEARLLYRKIDQHLLNVVTGRKDVTARVTVIDEAAAELPLAPER